MIEPPLSVLRVDDFAYELPPELIAQEPLPNRDDSRLLVVQRTSGTVNHARFLDLSKWLNPGDLLVANDSRVLPARLLAEKEDTGGKVEILLLREKEDGTWSALAKPARRLRVGTRLIVPARHGVAAPPAILTIVEVGASGEVSIVFSGDAVMRLADYGVAPLPPYIRRPLMDGERYQTLYGKVPGSAAAPTAGLHFTDKVMRSLRERGISWATVTLHVGLDTFRPVTAEFVHDHEIHREWCSVSEETARAIAETRQRGGRVFAVGTTAARTLESFAIDNDINSGRGYMGMTDLFIVPGYQWRVVDGLLTNFHLPRSTLLMMVSAFAGWELIKRSYEKAIAERYRFYSFGDATLIV